MAYIEPAIPPETPPETNLIEVNEEAGGVSATIRNLFGIFRRTDSNSDPTSNINHTVEPLHSSDQYSQQDFKVFKPDDVYIKNVDLKKDGSSMMSLSQVEANRRSSPCSYYQFAKGIYNRLANLTGNNTIRIM